MRGTLTVLALVVTVSLLHAAEVLAGASAGFTFSTFTGPAFSATVVLNADAVDNNGLVPDQPTVAIKLTKGNTNSGALFLSGYVAKFANGCDGTLGASTPDSNAPGVAAKTDARFLGVDWLPTDVVSALLAPFGVTPDPSHPLVFSDISNAVCTQPSRCRRIGTVSGSSPSRGRCSSGRSSRRAKAPSSL